MSKNYKPKVCKLESCQIVFNPTSPSQAYHSTQCQYIDTKMQRLANFIKWRKKHREENNARRRELRALKKLNKPAKNKT